MPAKGAQPTHERRGTPGGSIIANTRQVTIVSAEECAALAGLLGIAQVDPALLGANLMVQGLPALSSLMPATRLQFPCGATIFVTDQNQPCRHPGRLLALQCGRSELQFVFPRVAGGRRGLVGIVEREGVVRTGDRFMVIEPRRTLLAEGHESRCGLSFASAARFAASVRERTRTAGPSRR
jgi:MOSC domain-containing protein YiiM